jgi:hypothetical protein
MSLEEPKNLGPIRAGWLRRGWERDGLWHEQAAPADVMRARFAQFFRDNYREIVRIAAGE